MLAKVVVDATGDADLIARAGAACWSDIDESDIHHCINTAFLFGGVDMERWLAFRRDDPDNFAAFMARGAWLVTCGSSSGCSATRARPSSRCFST